MPNFLRHPRFPFAAICLISLGLVAGGVVMAQLLNLAACPLCIVQRMLYLLIGFIAAAGLAIGHPLVRRVVAADAAATAAIGMFVAGYQVWIQRFSRDTNCSANTPWWEQVVDWAGQQWPLMFQANGLCSDPAWKFLGLSIAEWSLTAFATLLALALYAAFRRLPA